MTDSSSSSAFDSFDSSRVFSLSPPEWDDLAILRAGIRFAQRVGHPPRRIDLREPARSAWEEQLGIALPTADQAASRFGSWGGYLERMGYGLPASSVDYALVEQAGLAHVEDAYPGIQFVRSEQNAWDATHVFDPAKGPEKVEVKAGSISRRKDGSGDAFFAFRLHEREYSKFIDRLILVGVGWHPDSDLLVPLVRLEIPKSALKALDGKSTLMIYVGAALGPNHSIYRPYVRWRAKVTPQEALRYVRLRNERPPARPVP